MLFKKFLRKEPFVNSLRAMGRSRPSDRQVRNRAQGKNTCYKILWLKIRKWRHTGILRGP